jgi:hypothetical protein
MCADHDRCTNAERDNYARPATGGVWGRQTSVPRTVLGRPERHQRPEAEEFQRRPGCAVILCHSMEESQTGRPVTEAADLEPGPRVACNSGCTPCPAPERPGSWRPWRNNRQDRTGRGGSFCCSPGDGVIAGVLGVIQACVAGYPVAVMADPSECCRRRPCRAAAGLF